MLLQEMEFQTYYHQYVAVEADDLTEELKDQIQVHDDDCFMLCTSCIDPDGELVFGVLGVGSSWQNCNRGMRRKRILGEIPAVLLADREIRTVQPDLNIIRRSQAWILSLEAGTDEDVMDSRTDSRLNSLRNFVFPDNVMTGILNRDRIREYEMKITGYNGPFLEGLLAEEPDSPIGIHQNEMIRALPYQVEDSFRLLAIFLGNHLSAQDQKAMQDLIQEGNKSGFGFSRTVMKS